MTRVLLAFALAAVGTGCPRGPVCAENGCPTETVCELDGTCRALSASATPTRDRHVAAADFGGTRSDQRTAPTGDLDELALGGHVDGEVFLAFDLPEGEVSQAILVLYPVEGAIGGDRQTVRVSRVRAFEGASLTHRTRPVVSRVGPGRELSAVPDRPVRVDVTDLLTEDPSERVHLMASGEGDGSPWRIASPVALDAERAPRLELRLRRR